MKPTLLIASFLACQCCAAQHFTSGPLRIRAESSPAMDSFFKKDPYWRGADGAASIDLGNGKILWLFSDTFIAADSFGTRKNAKIVRNSVALQEGYTPQTATLTYYWGHSGNKPRSFFHRPGKSWFWTGHGARIKDRLVLFLLEERSDPNNLGFVAKGWFAVIVYNPLDEPSHWKMKYVKGPDTYGTIAGSAAVLTDDRYLYAFGAVEPATHEVYLLRWPLDAVYQGKLSKPEWWSGEKWIFRTPNQPAPSALFVAQTEYSVHYDPQLRKYLQIQSEGFGAVGIGMRMADRPEGPWSELFPIYLPDYQGITQPFMYAAKAHPELQGEGLYVTYNVNSADFGELLENEGIYFPRFVRLLIVAR